MTDRFHIPGRIHPAYAPLGRLLRRYLGDDRQAAAVQLTVVVGLGVGAALAAAVAGSLLPDPAAFLARWGRALAVGVGLGAAAALAGWQPAIHVTCGRQGIRIRRGRRVDEVPYSDVSAASPLSPLRFHRHHARYAATRAYVNRMPPELLLLSTRSGPLVLGLRPADARAFLEALERHAARGARAEVGTSAARS